MDFKKILNSKATKVTAWVVLPTILVGGYFAVKYFIDKRNKSKWRKETPIIHTLTFDELLDVYITQKGKCMYSNKKLELFGDYMMSLERIDIKVGYIKENCCLICVELNVGDWSIVKNEYDDREGCSGWNKEKFNIIVNKIISMKTI